MRFSRVAAVIGTVLAIAGFGSAGETAGESATSSEHESLALWVGAWSGEGVMKPGPYGPGGPITWTESCDWFEGSTFHVVCRSEGTSPLGPTKGLGIIGYNPAKEVYTHYGVDNTGWSGYAEGHRSGDTWIYESEETVGDETFQTRYTVTMRTPNDVEFSYEMSQDGMSWTPIMEGTSTRQDLTPDHS